MLAPVYGQKVLKTQIQIKSVIEMENNNHAFRDWRVGYNKLFKQKYFVFNEVFFKPNKK
jgi:hypothetical protein